MTDEEALEILAYQVSLVDGEFRAEGDLPNEGREAIEHLRLRLLPERENENSVIT